MYSWKTIYAQSFLKSLMFLRHIEACLDPRGPPWSSGGGGKDLTWGKLGGDMRRIFEKALESLILRWRRSRRGSHLRQTWILALPPCRRLPSFPGPTLTEKAHVRDLQKFSNKSWRIVPPWNGTRSKMTSLAVSSLKAAASLPATTFDVC